MTCIEIVRLSGVDDHKRTKRKRIGQRKIAAQENSITDIEGGASVVCKRIVLIRNKARLRCSAAGEKPAWTTSGTCIAVGIVQHIKTKQRDSPPRVHPNIGDHLVLAENSTRDVLVYIGV